MRIAFFDAHQYEISSFEKELPNFSHEIIFLEPRLTLQTVGLAKNFPCVCSFVNDRIDRAAVRALADGGTRLLALRCAGFNHVDLAAAEEFGIRVVRVPEYSPHAVAEHAVAMILALNRKIYRSYNRVREGNFSLDGLVGFDLCGRTVGVIGTGRIGSVFSRIMRGFGCRVVAYEQSPREDLVSLGVEYVGLDALLAQSDLLSLHVPLTPETHHMINGKTLSLCKNGIMLINTSRGGLIHTRALIQALKNKQVAYAGLDVYEEEEGIFFHDLSETILQDDQLARLLTFPNVLMTSHQAFLTEDALINIARSTLNNVSEFERGSILNNEVCLSAHLKK